MLSRATGSSSCLDGIPATMPPTSRPLVPYKAFPRDRNVRQALIQNLTNLLHVCLLRNDLERAGRAWAILIRCREVDWKSKWHWGLQIHGGTSNEAESSAMGALDGEAIRDREKWLRKLMVRGKEEERPTLLHALVLHYIKCGKYREALDELELYLPSYPYLRSAPLHTYAGLLCFYRAQPSASKVFPSAAPRPARSASFSDSDDEDVSTRPGYVPPHPPADASDVRTARGWFLKAVLLDKNDRVAQSFLELIDGPVLADDDDPPDPPPIPPTHTSRGSDIGQFSPTPRSPVQEPQTPSTEGIDDFSGSDMNEGDDYSDIMSIG